MKIKNVRESVENNKNMYLPDNLGEVSDIYNTKIHAEVGAVYAAAVESDAKAQKHKEEVIKKLMQKAKHVVPKDNPSPMPAIKSYTTVKEPIELDESLFRDCDDEENCEEDEDEDKHKLQEATKASYFNSDKDVFSTIYNRLFIKNNKDIVPDEKVENRKFVYVYDDSKVDPEKYEKVEDNVYASKATTLKDCYDETQYWGNFAEEPGFDTIGIRIENEEQCKLAKAVADKFGFETRVEKGKDLGADLFKAVIYIDIPENISSQNFEIFKKQSEKKNESLKAPLTLDNFVPCMEAKATFDKIVESGKLDDFKDMIDNVYPDELTETELNNILMYESKFIFKTLGI